MRACRTDPRRRLPREPKACPPSPTSDALDTRGVGGVRDTATEAEATQLRLEAVAGVAGVRS